jgi:DNA-binding CsgD family transcriptional regulator
MFSSREIESLTTWLRAIHDPFESNCIEEWRHRVSCQGLRVLGADAALSVLPFRGHAPLMTWSDPGGHRASYLVEDGVEDPEAVRARTGVVRIRAKASAGWESWLGFSAETVDGERAEEFVRHSAPYIELATPAYRAAVAAVERLADHARALGSVMDELDEPLMVVDACGRVEHINRSLNAYLDRHPRSEELRESMRLSAARLLGLKCGGMEGFLVEPPRLDDYMPEAVFADPSLGDGAPLVLVRLASDGGPALGLDGLQERFGLTERQAEVAKLLVEGATAKRVAAALGIRTNTARNHIQAVLSRMGVSSKSELPVLLLGRPEAEPAE